MNIVEKVNRWIIYAFLNLFSPFLKPVLCLFKIVDFVMLVYPGTENDVLAYVPFAKLRRFVPTISFLGLIRRRKKGSRGLIVTSKYSVAEMTQNGKGKIVLALTKKLAEDIHAKKIALAGRLPAFLSQENDPLLLMGRDGTTFAVIETLYKVLEKEKLSLLDVRIGVLGVGFVGSEVLSDLEKLGFVSIIGVDPRFKKTHDRGKVKTGPNFSLLSNCDAVILLASEGQDIVDAIPYLREGVILIDDTHPPLSDFLTKHLEQERMVKVYKVVLSLPGVKIFPRFPNYEEKWIPGCAVEAIIASNGHAVSWNNQKEFAQLAREIGFQALLVRPKGEC